MKKIFTYLTFLLLFSIESFAQQPGTLPAKNLATVNQYSGMFVFFDCTPVREYEFVATVKKTFVVSGAIDAFTKYAAYAKEKYPSADGIIFHEIQMGFGPDKFDVIKFK